MSIQRLFFASQIKVSNDPVNALLNCLNRIYQEHDQAEVIANRAKSYTQQMQDSARIGVEVISGSVSVNGISYPDVRHSQDVNQNVALINLPPDKRIYIDKLQAKPTLLYVAEGTVELSSIPLQEKQFAWITDIEQIVITAISACAQTVLIKQS